MGFSVLGRVVLEADDWIVTIAATDRTNQISKELRPTNGYAITHVGNIEKKSGSAYTSKELEDLLSCLHYFLSFALGRWSSPSLPVGYNEQREVAFEQWGLMVTKEGQWNGSTSWFDEMHGNLLSEVFPGFYGLWKSEVWKQQLMHAIYWYLNAIDNNVDSGLILSQTALELLAWNYCVQERKMVSPRAFKRGGLIAADKLRLLATSLDIPKDIPTCLERLYKLACTDRIDSLDAITQIRNSLVHPDSKNSFEQFIFYETWQLSLWLIELTILRMCSHSGKYANRLKKRWVGQVDHVPWVK